jgi:cytochrome c biogenesis protein CcdA
MTEKERSAEIAAEIVEEAERLVRLQIALARQELKEMAINNGIAAGSFAGAGLLALIAVLVGIPVLVVTLVPDHWLAALIWVIFYLAVAAGLILLGRTRLQIRLPERTINSLKETRNWALRQMRSPGR